MKERKNERAFCTMKYGCHRICVLWQNSMKSKVREFESHCYITTGKLLFRFSFLVCQVELLVMSLSLRFSRHSVKAASPFPLSKTTAVGCTGYEEGEGGQDIG